MPLKILYIFLCFVFVHRSLGNGLDDAEQDIVQHLIANQTDLSSIPETSPDNLNVTRRNFGDDGIENEECEKAVTLKKTLKLLISLLSDSASTNSKTTDVLENLKDLLKNTPAGDAEVIDKIDDLVKTLDKYNEPGNKNDHEPLRSLDGLELDSSLKLKLEIPALANIYCNQQLLNILKATEQAYLNLARNPVCKIDVSDLPTIPTIIANLQFDDWDKPVRPDKNIVTPYYYPVFIDVNPDKNPNSQHESPDDHDQVQPNKFHPNKNLWSPSLHYNLVESGQERPINVNPVSPNYYPSDQDLNIYVNPNKNPGTTDYYPEFFDVKPDKNTVLQEYNAHGLGPNYYPELIDEKPDKNPVLQEYNAHGPGSNYYPEFVDVKPDKNPLLQEYNAHGPGPNYYPNFIDVKPDKNLVLQEYDAHGPGPSNYPKFIDLKPDKNPLLPDYYPFYGQDQVHPFDLNPDYDPKSKYYYPEFFDVTPEKEILAPDYYPHSAGEVWSDKTPAKPYYYPEYIDVNLDQIPVAPYYNPDSIPLRPVHAWDKNPFPYDAAPETLPLNPIFPYIPKTPSYPYSDDQKILPFETTPEAVNFVYPNVYTMPNQFKQKDFSENVIEPSVPIHEYPIFLPKENAPLNLYSLQSKYPENTYGINPYIANYVKQPVNSVLPNKIPIYTKLEQIYDENEVNTQPQLPPKHNIPVTPWDISIPPDQNQNIPNYSITNQNFQNIYPDEISPVNLNILLKDIPEYNIQANDQYPSHLIYPSNEYEISPLNPYSPYVPNQFRPQQTSPNPGPLIDIIPNPNEQRQPIKIIEFVREAIDVIEAVVPVVHFDQTTLYIIAKLKSILVSKDKDISYEQYFTILDLFGKVIEYVQQLEYYKQIKDIIALQAVSNHQKLETEKNVELTYLLKQPKPVVYYPYYYVKYSMPYRNFMIVVDNLLKQKPELKYKPKELYEELLAISKVVDVSPDLKNYNKEDLLKLTVNEGSLVDSKLIEENDALQKQLNILKNITSDLTTDDILYLKEYNNNYQQLTDAESDNHASIEPFILRDKKEADPSIVIGMQRMNDIFNSPNSHSSTFDSDKLREDILRGGKDSVNNHLRDAINNSDENYIRANNWIQKLSKATKEASPSPNVMSSNGYVQIDNQKITMNSGSGNRQDSVSVFNPKSTMTLAPSNLHDIEINVKSNPKDINDFLTSYIGPNMINYDNENMIMHPGDANYQNKIKITNPKLMPNQINAKESDADDLESATEQDGLTIESNPPLKWNQIDTSYKPTPIPESTNNYIINNMAGSNQGGVINHKVNGEQHLVMPKQPITSYENNMLYNGINSIPQHIEEVNDNEPLLISNNPAAGPGSIAYYGINGMGMPNKVGGINNQEQLFISNNPSAFPGSVAYHENIGMGVPNKVGGINNQEQLSISNNPSFPGSVAYYENNGMGVPNKVGGINNQEQLFISNNPSFPGSVAYYENHGIGVPNKVGGINNQEQLFISNNPSFPGSVAYYENHGIGVPNKVGGINNQEQLFISNNPSSFPGSVAYYENNGMGVPNKVGGINNQEQLFISNNLSAFPGSVAYYGNNGMGKPYQVKDINHEEQLLISNNPTAVSGGLSYYGINSAAANQVGVLDTQSTIHQGAEQLFPYVQEHIVDSEPDNNGLNGEAIKDSVFDDLQLTEKMKYNGNQGGGGGQGVINNVLQSITGHDHVLQNTFDSQDPVNLNNNGLHGGDVNQGMVEQQNLDNNNNVAVLGQNNYGYDNYLYGNQQNIGIPHLVPNSLNGNTIAQNIQSTLVHNVAPYSPALNMMGYGTGADMSGQKLVIQSMPVIYMRPYSYHQRITSRRPVVG